MFMSPQMIADKCKKKYIYKHKNLWTHDDTHVLTICTRNMHTAWEEWQTWRNWSRQCTRLVGLCFSVLVCMFHTDTWTGLGLSEDWLGSQRHTWSTSCSQQLPWDRRSGQRQAFLLGLHVLRVQEGQAQWVKVGIRRMAPTLVYPGLRGFPEHGIFKDRIRNVPGKLGQACHPVWILLLVFPWNLKQPSRPVVAPEAQNLGVGKWEGTENKVTMTLKCLSSSHPQKKLP